MGVGDRQHSHAYRRTSARLAAVGVLLLLLCSLGWGLGQALASSPSPSPSAEKVVLRVGYVGEPDNLNPFVAQVFPSYLIFSTNYDYLVGIDPATLVPSKETGLARDWSVSADGKTWTFTLRDTARWQDNGQPVTAQDVVFTYDYILKNDMSNFTSYTAGITRVTALDQYTVQMACSAPKADMLLSLNSIPVLPEHIWAEVPPKLAGTNYPNDPPIVGSGAFQCVKYKKSNYVIMEANKGYWRGAPKIDELIFQCYTNEDTMAQDLKAGTLDACTGLLNTQIQMFKNTPTVEVEPIRINGYDDVVFNCYEPPAGGKSLGNPVLRDWKFRQALQWAVDKQKIVSVVYYGDARPADAVIIGRLLHEPRLALVATGRPGLHVRPGQGRRGTDGRRLPAQERSAGRQAGHAHHAAPLGSPVQPHEPGDRQDAGRLAAAARSQDRARDPRQRRPHGQDLQHGRRHVRPGLRPVHLGLVQRHRPRAGRELLLHRPDQRLERQRLLQPRVRQALHVADARHRHGQAQGDPRPDAADHL